MALVFYEITDPFALDFGLNTIIKEYKKGQNLNEYIVDEVTFFNLEGTQLSKDYIPSNEEVILFSREVGAFQIIPYLIYMVISLVISFAMSMIFAPEELDLSDERPEYNTYLWGRGATKSEAMISVPIVLGKFPVYGNLISTISETQTITQGTHTLYDNIHLLYGLCSNPLESIEQINLNNTDAKEYDDSDLAVFYTLGKQGQGVIRAFNNNLTYDSSNKVYRYGSLKNDPVPNGDLLFKEFRTEIYPSYLLEKASHVQKNAVLFFEKQEDFNGKVIFQGVCDESGTLLHDDLLVSDDPNSGSLYILVDNYNIEKTSTSIDCSTADPLSEEYSKYCINGDEILYDEVSYEAVTETPEYFPSGKYILLMKGKPNYNNLTYKRINNTNPTTTGYTFTDTIYVEKVSDLSGNTSVLRVLKRSLLKETVKKGKVCVKAKVTEESVTLVDGAFDRFHTTPGSPYFYSTISTFGIEDIRLNLAATNGFFWRRVRHSNPVSYGEAWVSFKFDITQKVAGSTTNSISIVPIKADGSNRPPTNADIQNKVPIYFGGKYLSSVAFDISIAEVVDLVNNYSLHDFKTPTKISGEPGGLLTVTSDKKLPARDSNGRPYIYTVSISQYSHGIRFYETGWGVYYQAPNVTDQTEQEVLTIDLKVHRVSEINFNESLTYPGTSLLALSINATEALNNSLPNIQVICKSKFRVYDKNNPAHNINDLETWDYVFTDNPAFQCITLLYDSYYGAGLGGTSLNPLKKSLFSSLVDIPKFIEFAEYCDEEIEILGFSSPVKRHVCNAVIDDKVTVWKAITKILKVADAVPVLIGNKISLNYEKDEGDTPVPVDIFNSSNIIKDSLVETFQSTQDYTRSVSCEFFNEDNYYEQTGANLNISEADSEFDTSKTLTIDCFGITNVNRVYRKLRKAIRSSNLGKRIFSFKTSLSGLNLELGDVIGLNYEMVDWPTVSSINEGEEYTYHTFSGRVIFVDPINKKITLDTTFPLSSSETYKILIKASNTNIYHEYTVSSYSINAADQLVLTVTSSTNLSSFSTDDLYMVGKEVKLYKELVILEINAEKDNIFSIKAYEYFPELFQLGSYIITDFPNLNYTSDSITPQNLTAVTKNFSVTLTWSPPAIITKEGSHYISGTDRNLIIVKYLIYRKDHETTNDPTNTEPMNWRQIGEVGQDTLMYVDELSDFAIDADYQVVPVFLYNGKFVGVPRAWCNSIHVFKSFLHDFLPFPILSEVACLDSEDGEHSDLKLSITPPNEFTKDVNSEFYIAWVTKSTDNNMDWLGPQNITLAQSCSKGDSSIFVSSINGLPTREDGQVRCLITIGDSEVVFIDGSNNSTKELFIANANCYYPTTFNIDQDHTVGESIQSRHHGFFPVRVFATAQNNGLIRGKDRASCVTDSLYVYYVNDNTVRLKIPSEGDIQTNVPLWDYQVKQLQYQFEWRAQSGYDRAVVDLKGVKLATIDSNDKFIFEHGEFPNEFSDITFASARYTNDYKFVEWHPIFRDVNDYNIPPATIDTSGNIKAHIVNIAKNNEHYWVGLQYLIMFGDYGYTSYIKVI